MQLKNQMTMEMVKKVDKTPPLLQLSLIETKEQGRTASGFLWVIG